jgi:ABC-2 type transport system permease protein
MKRSWHRIFSLFYWATLELFLWGFITLWLKGVAPTDGRINFVLVLIGALIFWDLFSRAQQTIAVSFLEDVWSRNLVNIFVSPLTSREFIVGLLLLSIVQGFIAFGFIVFLAWALYALHIWSMGFFIIPFFLNIFLFGWTLGFVTIGLIIRFGPSVEILAWSIPVLFQPLSAVFYPISVLPDSLQKISFFLPTSHLFEGMRQVLSLKIFPIEDVIFATLFNGVYFIFGIAFFYWMLRLARKKGLLSRFTTD